MQSTGGLRGTGSRVRSSAGAQRNAVAPLVVPTSRRPSAAAATRRPGRRSRRPATRPCLSAAGSHGCICFGVTKCPARSLKKMSGECGVIRGMSDVHASRSEPGAPTSSRQVFSLVGALARLGCTRIGSPGIFGVQTPSAMCWTANPQVARERKSESYQANLARLPP